MEILKIADNGIFAFQRKIDNVGVSYYKKRFSGLEDNYFPVLHRHLSQVTLTKLDEARDARLRTAGGVLITGLMSSAIGSTFLMGIVPFQCVYGIYKEIDLQRSYLREEAIRQLISKQSLPTPSN